jgi:hypothetical protein
VDKKNDTELPEAKFYTIKNKKKTYHFNGNIQIIGINFNDKTFKWSWSLPIYPKNYIYLCNKILKYGIDLDIYENKGDNEFNEISVYIKSILTNSLIKLNDKVNLSLLESLILYITKSNAIIISQENNYDVWMIIYNLKEIN